MYIAVLSEGAFRCMNGSATSSGGAASTLAGTSGTAADEDDSAKPPGGGEGDVGVDGRHAPRLEARSPHAYGARVRCTRSPHSSRRFPLRLRRGLRIAKHALLARYSKWWQPHEL